MRTSASVELWDGRFFENQVRQRELRYQLLQPLALLLQPLYLNLGGVPYGVRPNVYYAWLKDFMEAGKTRLRADTVRDATQVEVERLKQESERLKQLVAELSLANLVLKKTAIPEFD